MSMSKPLSSDATKFAKSDELAAWMEAMVLPTSSYVVSPYLFNHWGGGGGGNGQVLAR